MRKLLPQILIALSCIAASALLSCSNDNGTNNDNDMIQLQYAQMKIITDQTVIPMATSCARAGVGHLNGVDSDDFDLGKTATPDGDSVMILYHPLSGWWEAFFSTQSDPDLDPYTELVVRDSIQFKALDGESQIEPNDSTDYVREIPSLHLSIESDSLNSTMEIFARNDVICDDLQSGVARINGPMSLILGMEIDTLGETIAGTISVTLQMEDLLIPIPENDEEEVCPLGGVITYTLLENLTSQFVSGETTNTSWSIRITIVDADTYLVKISAEKIQFDEYELAPEYVCSTEFATSAIGKAIGQLRHR